MHLCIAFFSSKTDTILAKLDHLLNFFAEQGMNLLSRIVQNVEHRILVNLQKFQGVDLDSPLMKTILMTKTVFVKGT